MIFENELIKLKKECLIYDIETSSHYPDSGKEILIGNFDAYVEHAIVKWVGMYSFKNNKIYLLNAITDGKKINKIINEHKIHIGFSNEEFDAPIMKNNGFYNPNHYKIQTDCKVILGKSVFKSRNGFPFKDRGNLMGYKFKNNKLRTMAEAMDLETQKGDIKYEIFHKDEWTEEETVEIKKYLKGDVMATKEMFDKLWDYWLPFTDLLDISSVLNLAWIRSSVASLTYKSACHFIGVEPTYGKKTSEKEAMGGHVYIPKYEEAKDVWYIDFASLYPHCMILANLFSECSPDADKDMVWNGNDMFKLKGTYNISKQHPLATHVMGLLKKRAVLKKTDPDNPMIVTIKNFCNALYGVVRSAIFEQVHTPNAGWDTCGMGQQIQKLTEDMMEEFGFETLAGDSVVKDSNIIIDDKYMPIEELWNQNKNETNFINGKERKLWEHGKILSCSKSFKNIYIAPQEIIRHKVDKKIFKINLTKQESISVTEDHSLIGLDSDLNYIEFSPKDILKKDARYVLFTRKFLNKKIKSKNLSKEIYNLMGMIVANGNVEDYRIKLSYEYIDEYYDKILSKIKIPHKFIKGSKKTDCSLSGKEIAKFFKNLEFRGNSYTKRIPEWLFSESEDNICEFLNGCMSGDGTVMLRKGKPLIRYTSINEELIDDLRILFFKVGIATSKIKETSENNYNGVFSGTYSYHVCILDRNEYKNKIGFVCDAKHNRLLNDELKQKVHIKKKSVNKNISCFANLVDTCDRDFIPRRIQSIKEIEYNDYVYDLCIPKYQKFYANNILVHNTDSLMVRAYDSKNSNREYVLGCLAKIVAKIKANVPFPIDTFDIDIEEHIKYIKFPLSYGPVVDEKIRKLFKDGIPEGYDTSTMLVGKKEKEIIVDINNGKIVKIGRSWVKEWYSKKKNYFFVVEKDGKDIVKLVGLPIKKENSSPLSLKIYKEVLEQQIIKQQHGNFDREYIEGIVDKWLKKPDIMKLLAIEYKIKPANTYKKESQIQAQISTGYLNGGDGIVFLVKNDTVGNAGKGWKYCTVEEAIANKLTIKNIDLTKLWNELEPFIKNERLDK